MKTEKIKQELLLIDSSGNTGIKFKKARKIAPDSIVIIYKKIMTDNGNYYVLKNSDTTHGEEITEYLNEKDMEILLNEIEVDNVTIDKLKNHC